MRLFTIALTACVALGCAGTTSSKEAVSPNESDESEAEAESHADPAPEADEEDDAERQSRDEARPAKKRRRKHRRPAEAAPAAPERAPAAPAAAAVDPSPTYNENAEQAASSLDTEAHKRCRWKSVPPYRPEWSDTMSPPLSRQRNGGLITSKPICPYGTPPAVLHVARRIAVENTRLNKGR